MKPKTRQNLLLAIMAVVCLLVARQYLSAVKLPTAGRVAAQERLLQSLQGDLKVARKVQEDRQASLKALHTLADPFWIPSGPAAKVDQEITAEFNRLARLAQLSSATGSQKVDVNKEKNGSCLQEVILSVEIKGVTMRDLTRLFTLLRSTPAGRKFRWDYCKLQVDSPKNPAAVNLSARFRVLVLNNEALAFLGLQDPAALKADASSRAPKARN